MINYASVEGLWLRHVKALYVYRAYRPPPNQTTCNDTSIDLKIVLTDLEDIETLPA
jgi:hypothetical protein